MSEEEIKFYNFNELIKEKEKLQKENKQLKSILTELEEWVKNDTLDFETTFYMGRAVNYKFILDKIQELKEKYK